MFATFSCQYDLDDKIKGKTMKKLKTVIFLSMLVILPFGAGAFDIGNPTGTGKLTVPISRLAAKERLLILKDL